MPVPTPYVGACADNAAMESFFRLLQENVLNRRRWTTKEQLRLAIITWIENTYHRRRRQDTLGRITPIEFETLTTPLTRPDRSYRNESIEVRADPADPASVTLSSRRWGENR